MNRRRFVLLGSALALAAGSTVTAVAAPSDTGTDNRAPQAERRVCAVPVAGSVGCHAHVVTDARTAAPLATATYQNGFNPQQLQTAYGPGGSKTTVAVVDAYAHPAAASDLAAYRSRFNLGTASFTQYNQSGKLSPLANSDVGWGQEEMLDLEMVSAMCPTCPIIYVGAKSASFNDMAAAVRAAKALGAKVISNSYGAPEFRGEATFESTYDIPGVAVTVSSGDAGYGAEYPAASKNVIAVGGTHLVLDSAGQRTSETVWSGAGSGCSAYISKPAWEDDTACGRRMVADISAVADPATGVAVYDSFGSSGGNNWLVFGGTSVAAPLIGALYASYGIGSGYPVALAWANRASLFDVTSGSNGHCTRGRNSTTGYFCTGGPLYDGPSGNGTPDHSGLPF